MKKKYTIIKNLSVAEELLNFINKELLQGTGVTEENFWSGFNKVVHELAPKNKELLEIRDELQKKIDDWHKKRKGKKFNLNEYTIFLKNIGYLKKPGAEFKIKTKNVDDEIAKNLRSSISCANLKRKICFKCC